MLRLNKISLEGCKSIRAPKNALVGVLRLWCYVFRMLAVGRLIVGSL
jgi:hypothetical protein